MQTRTFHHHLAAHPDAELLLLLPDGQPLPAHAHITEVGRVERRFLDCGGSDHRTVVTSLQAWVADDVDHRLRAGKLAAILALAEPILDDPAAPVEIECQQDTLSRYGVEDAVIVAGRLTIRLSLILADCLAKDVCLPPPTPANPASCCAGSGCC